MKNRFRSGRPYAVLGWEGRGKAPGGTEGPREDAVDIPHREITDAVGEGEGERLDPQLQGPIPAIGRAPLGNFGGGGGGIGSRVQEIVRSHCSYFFDGAVCMFVSM